MEFELVKSEFNEFINHQNKDFDDLIGELDSHFPYIKDESGVHEVVEHQTHPIDWEDFDVYLKLSHQKIIPPLHCYHLEFSLDTFDKICLSYEYFYEYKIELILAKEEAFQFVYPYVLSIVYIHYYYTYKEERKRKFRNIPLIGKMLSRIMVSDRFDMVVEDLHKESKKRLEKYVDSKLDDLDLRNRKQKYDHFFEGTPEEYRGMWIQM